MSVPIGQSLDQNQVIQLDSRPDEKGNFVGGVEPTTPIPRTAENLVALAASNLGARDDKVADFEIDFAKKLLTKTTTVSPATLPKI